jgi:hypothetical protein
VVGARQRASSTFRTFGLSRTSLALGIIPILNHDSPTKKSGYYSRETGNVGRTCGARGATRAPAFIAVEAAGR